MQPRYVVRLVSDYPPITHKLEDAAPPWFSTAIQALRTDLDNSMDAKIATLKQDLKQDLDAKMATLKQEIDVRFNSLGVRIATLEQEMDNRFNSLDTGLDGFRAKLNKLSILMAVVSWLSSKPCRWLIFSKL